MNFIKWPIISIVCFFIFTFIRLGYCYEVNVHKKITENAIDQNISLLNESLIKIGIPNGVNEYILGQRVRYWIEEGSIKEDEHFSPLVSFRYMNHFYNPLNNSGLADPPFFGMASSYEWGSNHAYNSWTWKLARDHFYNGLTKTTKAERESASANAFRALGQVMHLVEDLASPAHVRNDAHPTGDPYEVWTSANAASMVYSMVPFPYWNVSISPSAPKQFWDLESYDGSMAYDSGYIGLAEYTGANFYSKDTIGIEATYPHPNRLNTNLGNFSLFPTTVITTPDNITHTIFHVSGYGKQHLAALKYFGQEILELPGGDVLMRYKLSLFLDNECHKEYAQFLVPRAVGYSAGLLNYFFRGQIDMVPDPNNSGKYIIKNLSNENMSGTFSLYYDDKNDNRILITSWENLSINANGQSVPVNFTEPSSPEPKQKGKYLLVFQGSMGNETGAVAGKAVTLEKEIDVRMVIVSKYDSINYIHVITKNSAMYFQLPQKEFSQPQAVRFDVDDPNEFVLVTFQADNSMPYGSYGVYKFHRFTINITAQTIEHKGIVSSYYAVQKRDNNCSELCSIDVHELDGTECGDDYYSILFKVQDCTNVLNSNYFVDMFVKDGLIKPFGITKYVQTKTAGEDYYAMNSNCTEYVPMGWGYGLTYEYNITTAIYFGSEVKNIPFSSRGSYSVHPQCYIRDDIEAESPPYYWPIAVFNESDYTYGYNNENIITLPISIAGQKIKKTMIRKDGKYSFITSTKSYASEIAVVDCTGFLIGENRIGVRVDTWGASVVKFNSCSNWETLFSLSGTSLYPENRYIYDITVF